MLPSSAAAASHPTDAASGAAPVGTAAAAGCQARALIAAPPAGCSAAAGCQPPPGAASATLTAPLRSPAIQW